MDPKIAMRSAISTPWLISGSIDRFVKLHERALQRKGISRFPSARKESQFTLGTFSPCINFLGLWPDLLGDHRLGIKILGTLVRTIQLHQALINDLDGLPDFKQAHLSFCPSNPQGPHLPFAHGYFKIKFRID